MAALSSSSLAAATTVAAALARGSRRVASTRALPPSPQRRGIAAALIVASSDERKDPIVSRRAAKKSVFAAFWGIGTLVSAAAGPDAGEAADGEAFAEFTEAPSGIKFADTVIGTGNSPTKGARIRCHYRGKLASNGRQFDSSYDRGRPLVIQIGVGQVIRGWDMGILGDEGIPAMKEGGKRTLYIPAALAYGSRGAGGVIPPDADLVFDVELVK